MLKTVHNKYFYTGLLGIAIIVVAFFVLPYFIPSITVGNNESIETSNATTVLPLIEKTEEKAVKHLKTPEAVKGIYMTACAASMKSFRDKLVKLVDETELNSIIIDVKDYSGTISFDTKADFKNDGAGGCRIADLPEFLDYLHSKNIYTIARITAFQDPHITKVYPQWAIKKNSDKNVIWKDRKGISFIDAGNKEAWKFLADLGQESYDIGFDELNYDYIRFPSDGDMKDIYFPASDETLRAYATSTGYVTGKSVIMKSFFEYLNNYFKDKDVVLSADIFGMTTTNYDDLNIGQILEDAALNFDYVAPMVYPSHYPPGFLGYNTVAAINAHPYEIVKYSMDAAVRRLNILFTPRSEIGSTTATTTVSNRPEVLKLRPWLQDNDYPVRYTPEMVRAQIQATYDAGLTSWMLWDAGNTYTREALLVE